MGFMQLEIIQFLTGFALVTVSFFLIVRHREPLLESALGDNAKVQKSFKALTTMGYFLIFIPILLFGLNITPPAGYNTARHIQSIIYFEAGLIFLIGILHLGIMAIFSAKVKP